MPPAPRKHHYIPQFYLQGFTMEGTKAGQLWVLDKHTGRQWKASVDKAARETDLYKVELKDGGNPASFEEELAKIESTLAPVLKQTIERQALPKGRDFELLLNLVALMALRVPGYRSFLKNIGTAWFRQFTHGLVETREKWEAVIRKARTKRPELPDMPYEEMKRAVESGELSIDLDMGQNWFVMMILEASGEMLVHLSRRRWYLTVVPPQGPDFICSDNPVSLSGTPMSPNPGACGFAAPGTLLLFPLNRRMAVVGSFEGLMLPNPAPEKTVALVNGATARDSGRFLFSPAEDFVWLNNKKQVRHASDLVALIQERKRAAKEGRPEVGET
jgi:Protein of unknown function (DUF4238)